MKKDTKRGVNLMNKSATKERIKEAIDLEVENEMTVIDDLGRLMLIILFIIIYRYNIRLTT